MNAELELAIVVGANVVRGIGHRPLARIGVRFSDFNFCWNMGNVFRFMLTCFLRQKYSWRRVACKRLVQRCHVRGTDRWATLVNLFCGTVSLQRREPTTASKKQVI